MKYITLCQPLSSLTYRGALPSKQILPRRSFNLVHDLSSHARKRNMKQDPISFYLTSGFAFAIMLEANDMFVVSLSQEFPC